ncbi:hypothetical protein NIES4075_32900 [Tolypothrix sp. NIES-4075]|nr:hypothetical protein NIES4075_32900 [Tolypothrix sp. NIES-4075]
MNVVLPLTHYKLTFKEGFYMANYQTISEEKLKFGLIFFQDIYKVNLAL